MWVLGLKGLSKGVFERRTSTGSESFSLLISLDATKFVLLSVYSERNDLLENLFKIMAQDCKKSTSGWRVSLKNVAA